MPNFYFLQFFDCLRLNPSENITRVISAMLYYSSFVLERFDKIDYTLIFYKSAFYKNIEAEICEF